MRLSRLRKKVPHSVFEVFEIGKIEIFYLLKIVMNFDSGRMKHGLQFSALEVLEKMYWAYFADH